jgi:beta-lactamase class A
MTKPVSVDIKKSPKKDKKLRAIFKDRDGKVVKQTDFGAKGMSDYTIHKDKERRSRYRKRHKKDLDTKDFKRAGYLSYYILWGDSSNLQTAIKDYKKRFGLK